MTTSTSSPAKGKPCVKCGRNAEPTHRCEDGREPVFKGWFCSTCGHFDPAIGRERQFALPDKQ